MQISFFTKSFCIDVFIFVCKSKLWENIQLLWILTKCTASYILVKFEIQYILKGFVYYFHCQCWFQCSASFRQLHRAHSKIEDTPFSQPVSEIILRSRKHLGISTSDLQKAWNIPRIPNWPIGWCPNHWHQTPCWGEKENWSSIKKSILWAWIWSSSQARVTSTWKRVRHVCLGLTLFLKWGQNTQQEINIR